MNNPPASVDISLLIRQIAVLTFTLMLAILIWIIGSSWVQISDPYINQVLSLKGDPIQGHAIFQMNCAGCHMQQQGAQVGPSLQDISQRKSRVSIIQQVIGGKTPPMPQFQPDPQEMADLLNYLEQI